MVIAFTLQAIIVTFAKLLFFSDDQFAFGADGFFCFLFGSTSLYRFFAAFEQCVASATLFTFHQMAWVFLAENGVEGEAQEEEAGLHV